MEISSTRPVSSVRMRLFTTLNKFDKTFIGFDFLSDHKIPLGKGKSKPAHRQFVTITTNS